RAMFTGGMREASQDVIELKGVSAKGLKHIIDFAYSAEVTLDLDCIQDVLGAAVFLQMVPVVELCEEFLKSAMSVETCLNIGQMATTFSLASLKESVDAFTFRHFLQISEEEDFLHLPLERLVFFLQSNKLKSCSEIELFRAAVRWLQFDPGRRASASQVLCHIRFPLTNSWLRIQAMQESRIQFQLNVLRGVVYATGGRNRSGSLASVEKYCPKDNEWTYVCSLKRRTWGHAGATVGDKLYISGGYGISVEDKKALHCYDPATDQWEFKTPMNEPRVLHAMVSANSRIYALGGRMDHVDRCFDVLAVEYYVPETDQWTTVSPMRAGQSEAGCCLLEKKIYIVGGYNWHLNNVTSIVQVYNTETDEWERDLHFPESFAGI
ncbi:Kelch-like 26, partial [Corvus brachyrhynchos]